MRIKGPNTGAVDGGSSRPVERVNRTAPVSSATTPAAQAQAQTDSVSITDAARRLAALQESIASLPEVDAKRVTELRQAIEQGQYAADPGKIADRLLQLERDLAGAGQRQQR
jgi:negative regulator of flagellin synthesis FlgM